MQSFTLSSLLSESAIYMESSLGQGLSRVMNAAYNWILNWLRPEGTNLIPRIVWLNGCGDQATFSVLDMTSEQDWGGSGRTCTVQGICSLDGNRTSFSGLINGSLFVSTPSPPQLLSLWVQKLLVKSWNSLFPFFLNTSERNLFLALIQQWMPWLLLVVGSKDTCNNSCQALRSL